MQRVAATGRTGGVVPGGLNRQVVLTAIPEDRLNESHFTACEGEVPSHGREQLLVRTILIPVDPSNRSRMRRGPGYHDRIAPGEVVSALGPTGMTAYFGLLDVGRPKHGEALVVSAAAGATGNVAGQIGRIKGMRVVGITGSDDKNRML